MKTAQKGVETVTKTVKVESIRETPVNSNQNHQWISKSQYKCREKPTTLNSNDK